MTQKRKRTGFPVRFILCIGGFLHRVAKALGVEAVVFTYREKGYLISKEEWKELDLPIDTRMCNGIIFVKVKYDDENHIVHTYRYTNDGSENWKTHKPYEIAHMEITINE